MSLKECKKYIEVELEKETPKAKIEEHLKKNYREGLWKGLLIQYPERKDLKQNKRLNNALFYYVLTLFVLQIAAIIYLVIETLAIWPILISFWLNMNILLELIILLEVRKGIAYIYAVALIYPIFGLREGILGLILFLPVGIMSYILKKRLHPNYGFFGPKKPKVNTGH
ncbi:hypothetical protein HZC31_01880 [Candidatus Woesearchaeota archaeon]|nr:hypothetical protein [Candidatus Woesearchaeota archaeon]